MKNTIICLGSGIRADESEGSIRTTLNQTRSPVHVLQNGKKREFPLGADVAFEFSTEVPLGVWHDNVSYLIGTGKAGFSAAVRPADWATLVEINEGKRAVGEAAVFHLFLDHGQAAADDIGYAYVVRPATTPEEMEGSLETPTGTAPSASRPARRSGPDGCRRSWGCIRTDERIRSH